MELGYSNPQEKNVIQHVEHWVWLHFSIFCVFLGFTISADPGRRKGERARE
jgi:hypothetical protein